ncbi:MAG: hypothetical protein ACHQWU_04960 [Gemmatimonadales bacterium]
MSAAAGIGKFLWKEELTKHARLAGILACLLVGVGAGWLMHPNANAPSIPPKEQHALDSMAFTAPIFAQHIQSLAHAETVYVAAARHDAQRAAVDLHEGASLAKLADSLNTIAAIAHDTSSRLEAVAATWHAAYDSAHAAAVELQAAHVADSLAIITADSARIGALARLAVTTDLNARLAADLKASDPPCRVLALFHCPSRRLAFVGGAAVALAAPLVVKALKP